MTSESSKLKYAMSRYRRNIIFAAAMMLFVVFVLLDHTYNRNHSRQEPGTESQKTSWDFDKYHGKSFLVIKIVDGDMIDVNTSDGDYPHTRIRLWGVDTPETKTDKTGVMFFSARKLPILLRSWSWAKR